MEAAGAVAQPQAAQLREVQMQAVPLWAELPLAEFGQLAPQALRPQVPVHGALRLEAHAPASAYPAKGSPAKGQPE